MNQVEQKTAAKAFVERWQAAEGNEQRESNSFWIELCSEVLGIPNPTHVLNFERKVQGKRIDVLYDDMGILIENKSRGVDLDKQYERGKNEGGEARVVTPYQQAKWYADNMPRSQSPRWLITCNFDEIRIYDLENEAPQDNYETLLLEELPNLVHRLSFFTRKEGSRLEREKKLSVAAGEVVGKLYDHLSRRYNDIENDEYEQKSLNILITRIVFLLYAEDSGLLQEHQAFFNYLKGYKAEHMAGALRDLFKVLKTPDGKNGLPDERTPLYLSDELSAFPYINGGLFETDIAIPQFDEDLRFTLLQEASAEFDWKDISPTIFGAVFESTLNPETRRAGGMHYTSVENIHKVTGPLFYDALYDELSEIEGESQKQKREFRLKEFREKIANIKVLDPACGSGNFLTETYLGLRKLENRVLENLYGSDQVRLFQMDPIMVTVDQFYGIEINDFAVEVAKTALWIAELQMLEQTREIMNMWIEPLPLKSNDNIHCGNALRMDWNSVLPAEQCNYIIGNPPFVGANNQTPEQKADVQRIFSGHHDASLIDYVGCWYKLAFEYAHHKNIETAFVSTNSICQGEQVGNMWGPLFKSGLIINFAHDTFRWRNEANEQAHVFVVVIGFSSTAKGCRLFHHPTPDSDAICIEPSNINAYLVSADNVFVMRRNKPLCSVPKMTKGCQPTDGGNLIVEADELEGLLQKEPAAAKYIKKLIGAKEFIQRQERYCIWLVDATEAEISAMPVVANRVKAVRDFRLASSQAGTRKLAERPSTFRETYNPDTCLVVPMASSERRRYLPMGFIGNDTVSTNLNLIVQDATLYHFGIMSSLMHMVWLRTVCGRLKSDYRYSAGVVYNNFIWPNPTEPQKQHIEWCAQQVLETRDRYPDKSLADLYDPDKMPSDLEQAHTDLDNAVEVAYGVNFGGDEEKIVTHLFKLYAEAAANE